MRIMICGFNELTGCFFSLRDSLVAHDHQLHIFEFVYEFSLDVGHQFSVLILDDFVKMIQDDQQTQRSIFGHFLQLLNFIIN